MRIQATRLFQRDYALLPDALKDRADKQLALLMSNPRHPSLRLKRIQGTADVWEVRVTRSHRLTLQIVGDVFLLRRIGAHDVLKQP